MTNLAAQHEPTVSPGTRVRLWAPELSIHKQPGTITAMDADTFVVSIENIANPLIIPSSTVTRLEVSRGLKSQRGKGALIGFGAGAAIGIGFSVWFTNAGEFDFDKVALVFVPIFTAAGGGLGALFGAMRKEERWESVSLPIRIGILPHYNGGITLSMSLVF